ncbi:stringent starvation protein B [Brackiella oedipodis]|uniref:stringent starvation protein B n=1 Tax=Brackiella oedipodis TaxID=124225 RepID=UPI00048FF425|nr:ClpXP protease specificity-enhancing factor SspB [Brackiella oedipodis]
MTTSSSKAELIQAWYNWCLDQGQTPHVVVRVDANCQVPQALVKDGVIVFNIGFTATKDFFISDEYISFEARFSGRAQQISVPIARCEAFFSRESQEGMNFRVSEDYELSAPEEGAAPKLHSSRNNRSSTKSDKPKKSVLKIIK